MVFPPPQKKKVSFAVPRVPSTPPSAYKRKPEDEIETLFERPPKKQKDFQLDFCPKASYYCSPLLTSSLILCKECRDYTGSRLVEVDEEKNVFLTFRLCPQCQKLNRCSRLQYRRVMFPDDAPSSSKQ